jgi:ABC-type uncharacterized transport system substrate-binding protein
MLCRVVLVYCALARKDLFNDDTQYMLQAGGLLSYALSLAERGRRTAIFIDKILRGAKSADLPVKQPTKFELGST